MPKLLRDESAGTLGRLGVPVDQISANPPLLTVLWRRRWTLGLTAGAFLFVGVLYLTVATPIYQAAARVAIDEHAPSMLRDVEGYRGDSENFLQTQATVFKSTAVLNRALAPLEPRSMKTFRHVEGDLANFLQSNDNLSVETQKKSDVINISFDSAYPEEAAIFVNNLVDAYIAETTRQKRDVGGDMVTALNSEKDRINQRLDQTTRAMLKFKRDNNVLSFREDKGNIALERTTTLSTTLTSAEIATIELRAQKSATEAAINNPDSMRSWVEAQQFKGRDFGDREYDDLRQQLSQAVLSHASAVTIQGEKHRNVQFLASRIEALQQRIAEKEKSIAKSHLVQLDAELQAAVGKENQLRVALEAQQDRTLDLGPDSVAYAKLENESQRLQKQIETIDARIGELSMNTVNAVPLNVRILEPAHIASSPIKPKKPLILLASLMCGCLGGLGLAMMREWQDARLREPEEIPAFLGVPVVAVVPRINPRLSPVTRGQIVHLDARSPVAESYRSIRTALKLGNAADAKTILLASAAPGDGKSTTASNLAIAFAQAGERTLLVDCDLREPVQHMIFETDPGLGLSGVMSGETTAPEAIVHTSIANLHLLPCGPVPQNPAELLASPKFSRLMHSLCESFDRIIIDSPPLTCVTDAQILASAADATLLVLRLNLSIRKLGVEAVDMLEKIGANLLGAIANDAAPSRGYSYYGGSWTYASHSQRSLPQQVDRQRALARIGNNGIAKTNAPVNEAAKLADAMIKANEPSWSDEPAQSRA